MNHPRSNVSGVIIRDNKVLLVEIDDESGLHYNFPGGGVELNETVYDALKREMWEETRAIVTVGRLLVVWDYIPPDNDRYGNIHKVNHLFQCELADGSEPTMPETPDKNQVGIRWIDIDQIPSIILYPNFGDDLVRVITGELVDIYYGTLH